MSERESYIYRMNEITIWLFSLCECSQEIGNTLHAKCAFVCDVCKGVFGCGVED